MLFALTQSTQITMSQKLTENEISKTRELCFSNPVKACEVAQTIIDTCRA
jgi:hypothetical protein